MFFAFLVVAGIFWFAPIFVGQQIGKGKGRAGWAWGLLLGWLGVIIVAVLPATDRTSLGRMYRECPHCKEGMRRDAGTCPHCHNSSTPWQFQDGYWWVRLSDEEPWQWLDETTNTWRVKKTNSLDPANRKCPHCKEKMPRAAETCPHCHHSSTPWRFYQGRWWVRTSEEAPWQWLDETTGTWSVGKAVVAEQASESP
jgi:RNA polymerase subunit RPABC4/transcription elongation factor Spt4